MIQLNTLQRAFFLLFLPIQLLALDPYDCIDALLSKDQLPRILNSTDIELKPEDPQPLFSPMGDFNGDGILDVAISGIYGLPKKNKYFLLIGTELASPVRYEKLFFQEYVHPVFLHKPGTTGEKDPGDQAFSVTPCMDCSDGVDFYWNSSKNRFDQAQWLKRVRHYQSVPHIPELDILPQETINAALQIVGELPDIKIYVAGLKRAHGKLGTRVSRKSLRGEEATMNYLVEVFEKKKSAEKLYDRLEVDLIGKKVVSRLRRFKLSDGAKDTH